MKKLFYIKTAFISLSAMMLLSSCLKDNAHFVNFAGVSPVVDFALTANLGSVQTAQLSAAATTNTVNFLVSCSAPNDINTPVTVTAIVDPAALAAANAAALAAPKPQPTYTLLPASAYTISSLTLTIYPGISQVISNSEPIVGTPVTLPQGQAAFSFTVNTAAALPSGTYALPLTITNVSGAGAILDQYHTLIYVITVK